MTGACYMSEPDRRYAPLFLAEETKEAPTRARHLAFSECPKPHAVSLVRAWHSRLPECQAGPWSHAFHAYHDGASYAVALWNNPSARTLPQSWRELRRMAVAPDAPKYTASMFLGWMARWFQRHEPSVDKLISYQDTSVHQGTIYKAAGWVAAHESTPRTRDRSGLRANTTRLYRWNVNGADADAAAKVRWEKGLKRS